MRHPWTCPGGIPLPADVVAAINALKDCDDTPSGETSTIGEMYDYVAEMIGGELPLLGTFLYEQGFETQSLAAVRWYKYAAFLAHLAWGAVREDEGAVNLFRPHVPERRAEAARVAYMKLGDYEYALLSGCETRHNWLN